MIRQTYETPILYIITILISIPFLEATIFNLQPNQYTRKSWILRSQNIYKRYVDSMIGFSESLSSSGAEVIADIVKHNRKFKARFLKMGEEKTSGITRGGVEKRA